MAEESVTHELALLDKYWRAANYLSVGQIYLMGTRYCAPLQRSTSNHVCSDIGGRLLALILFMLI